MKLNSNYLELTKHKSLNAPEWGLIKGPETSGLCLWQRHFAEKKL